MNINRVQFINLSKRSDTENKKVLQPYVGSFYKNELPQDCFIKSNNIHSISNSTAPGNVSFRGAVVWSNYDFEKMFPRSFFKKLLRESVRDAYSQIKLIPRETYDQIREFGGLNRKSSVTIKILKPFKERMFPIEKEIFGILEHQSKKYPNLTLQELLKLKYKHAEEILIKKQSKVLNKMNMMIRELPRKEYIEVRNLIQKSFNKIFEPDPLPEERFRRKIFLKELKAINLTNATIQRKLYKTAENLPQATNDVNAFIVKYSQPYKFKYIEGSDVYKKTVRNSQEVALRLLEPSLGTDDHIYPQKRFMEEELARQNGDKAAKNLSKLRVTILTSKKYNELKSDSSIDQFIATTDLRILDYIQQQMDDLVRIAQKWAKQGKTKDAALLCNYITIVKAEYEARSSLVKIDLRDFEEEIQKIKLTAQKTVEKQNKKRLKKTGHADNNHKAHEANTDGSKIENRKKQKHSPKYNQ